VDDFYTARDSILPPLPWPSIAPPFTPLLFAGKTTIAMAREVYGITDPDDEQMRLF